ncbi:MAG: hypothetical protein IT305_15115 [Chloroflexi bacterium]|nr:hypothetical protein [Chloroflexota bacterium]
MLTPDRPIRRFDVFAEYRKQEEERSGMPEDVAMGYGLWIAKVVASRRFGGATLRAGRRPAGHRGEQDEHVEPTPPLVDGKWHTLDDEPQTSALFEREIVERMGPAFYHQVFVPAIEDALQHGKRYEQIRDSIRKDWKPT